MPRKLFIQTGQTPPRGHIVTSDLIRPSENNRKKNNATVFVTGSPYRRVYRDAEGMFINVKGDKRRVFQVEFA